VRQAIANACTANAFSRSKDQTVCERACDRNIIDNDNCDETKSALSD
jgi:hypothetical protein